MRAHPRLVWLLASLAGSGAWAGDYVDPDGAFALALPPTWEARRAVLQPGTVLTECGVPDQALKPVTVLCLSPAQPPSAAQLADVAAVLFGVLRTSAPQFHLAQPGPVTFAGTPALRAEFDCESPPGQSSHGHGTVLLSARRAFLVVALAPRGQAEALTAAEAVLDSFAPEARTPRAPATVLDAAGLAAAAAAVRGGLQRRADEVLVAGEPPLTNGSVVDFARLLSLVCAVELSEAEFALTRERFVECYRQSDAGGRAVLAQSAGRILAGLNAGSPAARAQQTAEVRAQFEQRLQAGAQAGIAWAKVLHSALERRRQVVARTTAPAPAQALGTKTDLTAADLDAACELLYFLWVGAGRDPGAVTPALVAQVRAALAAGFPRCSPQVQSLLTNAQTVYSRIRQLWMTANAAQRAQLAREFGQALDELGFKDPRAAAQSSGSSLAGELVVNTAYNLSQRATGGAWPSSAPRSPWGGG